MTHQSYYRDPSVEDNDFWSGAVPLQVNCAGCHRFRGLRGSSTRSDTYLFYLAEGEAEIGAPASAAGILRAGDFVLFEGGVPFSYRGAADALTVHFWAHFTGSGVPVLLRQCGLETGRIFRGEASQGIEEGFEALFRAFLIRDRFFDAASAGALLSILLLLGRSARAEGEKRPARGRLDPSLRYLHTHFDEAVAIGELAEMEYLSPSRFRALFREETGVSPQEYLARLRFRHGCELLKNTGMPVSEVAARCGFPDQRYFARFFSARAGMSARAYREQFRRAGPGAT